MYCVFSTTQFDKEVLKQLPSLQQEQVERLKTKQLLTNPYVGDPIDYRFLREKKLKDKRVYFLVYEEFKAVLLIAVSDKKQQQKTIDCSQRDLDAFYLYMKELMQHVARGHA